jgi:hypothetical protein
MTPTIFGSILHGAYGDYYEQAVCLKDFSLKHPDVRLKLFAAASHRLEELRVLDFSWADGFELYTQIPEHPVDKFFQFQIRDRELRDEIFPKLPPEALCKLQSEENRLPWAYLRSILPLAPAKQIGLSDLGLSRLPVVMQENGIDPEVFNRPTIGFLWRHRAPGGAIRASLQSDAKKLVEKYARLFRRLIDTYGCHILICGMKVPRTRENMHRIDAKFSEYGLDLPHESSTHLKGLSWALELEVLSRCTLCVANPSGFSEALWIKRGGRVLLVDPTPDYLTKALWHRMPFFNLQQPRLLLSALASRWEQVAYNTISAELDQTLQQSAHRAVAYLQNIVP